MSSGCSMATWTSVWPSLPQKKERKSAGKRKQSIVCAAKKRPLNLIQHHCLCLSPDSVTGWLTMKVVLYAVRLGPCGGWSLSESGDCFLTVIDICLSQLHVNKVSVLLLVYTLSINQ